MLRRFILVSGLIAASALGFAGSASAESVTAQFGGNISGTCSIGDPVVTDGSEVFPGVLTYDDTAKSFSASTPVEIDVACDGGNLSVTVNQSGGTTSVATIEATVTPGSGTPIVATNSTAGSGFIPAATNKLSVNMNAAFALTDTPAADAYKFDVVLTATP